MKRLKGLYLDTLPVDQPEGTYRNAKNINLNLDVGSISTEEGTIKITGSIPQDYFVICHIPIYDGRIVVFSASSNGGSEIGVIYNNTYTQLINDSNLNFNISNKIQATFKINNKEECIVYWTDGLNPPRFMNIDDIPEYSDVTELNIFPNIAKFPTVHLNQVDNVGGSLYSGTYQIAIAFSDADENRTDYISISNVISINNIGEGYIANTPTSKAIELNISDIDTSYSYVEFAIIHYSEGSISPVKIIKNIPISSESMVWIYTGLESYIEGSLDDIVINGANYITAETLTQHDGDLYLGNLTKREDIGYQKYANNIEVKYTEKVVSPNSNFYFNIPLNHYENRTYQRDQPYAFYISFILNNGSESYAYHIPGRTAELDELSNLSGSSDDPNEVLFYNMDNDAKRFHYESKGVFNRLAYWENENELYPDTDDFDVYDVDSNGDGIIHSTKPSLRGEKVRHHKIPEIMHNPHINEDASEMTLVGVTLENVKIPKDILEQVIGFKVYYAKRTNSSNLVLGHSLLIPQEITVSDGVTYLTNDIPENNESGTIDTSLFAIHPFDLIRTQGSIGSLTHIKNYSIAGDNDKRLTKPYSTSSDHANAATFKPISPLSIGSPNRFRSVIHKSHIPFNTDMVSIKPLGFFYDKKSTKEESQIVIQTVGNINETYDTGNPGNNKLKYSFLSTLHSHKKNVYDPFDLQELVWTGFIETDLDKYDPRSPGFAGTKATGSIVVNSGTTTFDYLIDDITLSIRPGDDDYNEDIDISIVGDLTVIQLAELIVYEINNQSSYYEAALDNSNSFIITSKSPSVDFNGAVTFNFGNSQVDADYNNLSGGTAGSSAIGDITIENGVNVSNGTKATGSITITNGSTTFDYTIDHITLSFRPDNQSYNEDIDIHIVGNLTKEQIAELIAYEINKQSSYYDASLSSLDTILIEAKQPDWDFDGDVQINFRDTEVDADYSISGTITGGHHGVIASGSITVTQGVTLPPAIKATCEIEITQAPNINGSVIITYANHDPVEVAVSSAFDIDDLGFAIVSELLSNAFVRATYNNITKRITFEAVTAGEDENGKVVDIDSNLSGAAFSPNNEEMAGGVDAIELDTYDIDFDGNTYNVTLAHSDSTTQVASKIAAELNSNPNYTVNAVGAVVSITAVAKGSSYNSAITLTANNTTVTANKSNVTGGINEALSSGSVEITSGSKSISGRASTQVTADITNPSYDKVFNLEMSFDSVNFNLLLDADGLTEADLHYALVDKFRSTSALNDNWLITYDLKIISRTSNSSENGKLLVSQVDYLLETPPVTDVVLVESPTTSGGASSVIDNVQVTIAGTTRPLPITEGMSISQVADALEDLINNEFALFVGTRSGSNKVDIEALTVGTAYNGAISFNYGNSGVTATKEDMSGGTNPVVLDTYDITFGGSTYNVTLSNGDSANTVASKIASELNGSANYNASSQNNVVTIEAVSIGTSYNSVISLDAGNTGVSASKNNLSGGTNQAYSTSGVEITNGSKTIYGRSNTQIQADITNSFNHPFSLEMQFDGVNFNSLIDGSTLTQSSLNESIINSFRGNSTLNSNWVITNDLKIISRTSTNSNNNKSLTSTINYLLETPPTPDVVLVESDPTTGGTSSILDDIQIDIGGSAMNISLSEGLTASQVRDEIFDAIENFYFNYTPTKVSSTTIDLEAVLPGSFWNAPISFQYGNTGVTTTNDDLSGGIDPLNITAPIFGGDTYIGHYGYRVTKEEDEKKLIVGIYAESMSNITNRSSGIEFGQLNANLISNWAEILDFEEDDPNPDSWYDNYFEYDEAYSRLPLLKSAIPKPKIQNEVVRFPQRIIRSQGSVTQSNFRRFLENDYLDIPSNRGEVVNIETFNDILLIHTKRGLFRTRGREELVSGDFRAYIGSGNIFEVKPSELFSTTAGFAGMKNKDHYISTPAGYIFLDEDVKKIYSLSDGINELSDIGLSRFFDKELEWNIDSIINHEENPFTKISLGYDNVYNRFLFTKTDYKPTPIMILGVKENIITLNNTSKKYQSEYNFNVGVGVLTSSTSQNYIDFSGSSLEDGYLSVGDYIYSDNGFIGIVASIVDDERINLTNNALINETSVNWYYRSGQTTGMVTIEYSNEDFFEDKSFTLSYMPEINAWVSFHDYKPLSYISGINSIYSSIGEDIYSHNNTEDYCKFYGQQYPFYIQVVDNREPRLNKILLNIEYETHSINTITNKVVWNDNFDKFRIRNDIQDSGIQNIVYFNLTNGNARNINGTWKINKFRDFVNPSTGNLDVNLPWNKQKKIIGKYVLIDLYYDTFTKTKFTLVSLNANYKESYR